MFLPYKTEAGNVIPWEYLPSGAIAMKLGMALTQAAGLLSAATGSTVPTYIAMAGYPGAVAAGTIVPVIRVDRSTVFETTNQASFAAIKRGDKVTLHSDGMQVTATKTGGIAEVVDYDAKAAAGAGGRVWVRF